jgi:hypothetical protein
LGLYVHPSPSSRHHLHSIHQMSIIHHTKRWLKNFNKRGQLISTLTRTFYEASAAEEEDWRWLRGRGDNAEDGAVDVCSGPFRLRARAAGQPAAAPAFWGEKLSVILRARAAGGGERDMPAGTSEHTDRASDLLRRKSECCCQNRSGLLQRERASGVGRRRHRQDNNMRLQCEKKGDPGWQSKETHPTSMRLQYEIIGNGLYSPLLIGHWSVTDFTSPLLICLTFVMSSFNIRYKEFL